VCFADSAAASSTPGLGGIGFEDKSDLIGSVVSFLAESAASVAVELKFVAFGESLPATSSKSPQPRWDLPGTRCPLSGTSAPTLFRGFWQDCPVACFSHLGSF
jgi:hypothetical protein